MDREATQYEQILMCDLRDAIWQLRREKEEEQQHVQRIQEENGELRQMIVQLEKEKDEFNKKMKENEQIDLKEKSNFSCFSRCIVVFVLLGLLFVLKYSSL